MLLMHSEGQTGPMRQIYLSPRIFSAEFSHEATNIPLLRVLLELALDELSYVFDLF